ncbi:MULTISPECIES: hypothetical protein [unclassified Microbacterium]|uniref:hypothetical protein n=1 Tax=unclassified Microbacterium TaxID=2609290 RepID=UPI00214B726C|nr:MULTISPECIES: hypothetical protein [unclassified Microbacterium]MCR2811395.1 hypothetical protein [Microbacterium sp. zg.B185]WIM19559.1 hypothetical protein QNO12_01755 [Microbacterium sp. zg-B185]
MAIELTRPPTEYVSRFSDTLGTALKDLRGAALAAGPLDATTSELIVISHFAMSGFEDSFMIHSRRLLGNNTPIAALRHAVVLPLGATAGGYQIARALEWIDQLEAEFEARV